MYLLDTNVLSELRKISNGRADLRVVRWSSSVDIETLFLSVMTILEVETGILRLHRHDSIQADILRVWMRDSVMPVFTSRILSVDIEVARCAATINVPDRRPTRDGLIAATGLVHDLRVVTRNVADFAGTGVTIFDPWAE